MQDPQKLHVYREAKELALEVYRLTEEFPREERFGLSAQLRSAVVGIGSCIAEGCGRRTSRDSGMFWSRALGSCREVTFQLDLARSLRMVSADRNVDPVLARSRRVERMLTRLIVRAREADG